MQPLDEFALRILSELDEAGEENALAMINTITDRTGSSDEIEAFGRSSLQLFGLGYVRMATQRNSSGKLERGFREASAANIGNALGFFEFDRSAGYWHKFWSTIPPFPEPFPYFMNTDIGRQRGLVILNERGYQWWRRK